MRGALALILCMAVGANAFAARLSKETRKRIEALDDRVELLRSVRRVDDKSDIRGRRHGEDVAQWAFSDATEAKIAGLLKQARHAGDAGVEPLLREADQLLDQAQRQAIDIAGYWSAVRRQSWRYRWRTFFSVNHITPAEPAPELAAAELALVSKLEVGDFRGGAADQRALEELLATQLGIHRRELAKIDSRALDFRPPKSPCTTTAPGNSTRTRIVIAAHPSDYYPPASLQRREEGAIVVRTRVGANNCPTGFALVVRSDYPALDEAALEVAEASQYEAATENGQAQPGEINFTVTFALKW